MKRKLPDRYVTKVAWDTLREPFRQVLAKETDEYHIDDLGVLITRIHKYGRAPRGYDIIQLTFLDRGSLA